MNYFATIYKKLYSKAYLYKSNKDIFQTIEKIAFYLYFYVWYFQLNFEDFWKWRYSIFQKACDTVIDKLSEGMTVVQSLEVKTISGLDWFCGAEYTAFPECHLMKWSIPHLTQCLHSRHPN